MVTRLDMKIDALNRRESGQVLVLFALMLTVLMGVVALALDGGNFYLTQRRLQAAADLGAITGGEYLAEHTHDYAGASSRALDATLQNASELQAANVTVNVPPTSGPHTGDPQHVEVIISYDQPTYFAGVIGLHTATIQARAVARAGRDSSPYAVLALSPNASPGINFGGGGNVSTNGAGIMSNSGVSSSVKHTSGGSVTIGGPVNAVGGINGSYIAAGQILGGVPFYPDPFATMPAPSFGSPGTNQPYVANGSPTNPQQLHIPSSGGPLPPGASYLGSPNTFAPGVYYGGIKIDGGSYGFAPGIYILAGGGLAITGGNVTGSGLFFYNTQDPSQTNGSGAFGPVNINDTTGTVSFSPSSTPLYPGMAGNILFFQDRAATSTTSAFSIQANGNTSLSGTIYVPTNDVSIAGGGNSGVVNGQVIADTVSFTGSATSGVTYNASYAAFRDGATLDE